MKQFSILSKKQTETDWTDKIHSTGCYERSMEQMFTIHIHALIFKHYVFLWQPLLCLLSLPLPSLPFAPFILPCFNPLCAASGTWDSTFFSGVKMTHYNNLPWLSGTTKKFFFTVWHISLCTGSACVSAYSIMHHQLSCSQGEIVNIFLNLNNQPNYFFI